MRKIAKALLVFTLVLASCSEDIMDNINKDRNSAFYMKAENLIPDLLLKSAYESTATDIAWYTTVYIEHNAGTWNQSYLADRRQGQTSHSLFDNSWNSIYDVMMIAKTILDKTDSIKGDEKENYWCRGVAQVMIAYNLAIATDMWGEVPYTDAFKGLNNLKPSYEKQSELYGIIQNLLDEAIQNFVKTTRFYQSSDYLFGDLNNNLNRAAWIKTAYSLKARYYLRLTNKNGTQAAIDALDALVKGFDVDRDAMIFRGFQDELTMLNPWGEFWLLRDHLSVSSTIWNLLYERNDPRGDMYFTSNDEIDIAPIGEADQVMGWYSQSRYTNSEDAFDQPILMFTYHELKFIEAEAKFRLEDAGWRDALAEAIEAAFIFHRIAGAYEYYLDEVEPRLTEGNELAEIITQKYIAFFDREAIEAYNDYRRTGFPEMKNPNNATTGFVHRFPYALSEVNSNSGNLPSVDIFKDKVWWAGGEEKK